MKGIKDITFFEGTVPVVPDHGSVTEIQHGWVQVVDLLRTTPGPTLALTEVADVILGTVFMCFVFPVPFFW